MSTSCGTLTIVEDQPPNGGNGGDGGNGGNGGDGGNGGNGGDGNGDQPPSPIAGLTQRQLLLGAGLLTAGGIVFAATRDGDGRRPRRAPRRRRPRQPRTSRR